MIEVYTVTPKNCNIIETKKKESKKYNYSTSDDIIEWWLKDA
jgi:hypothetical protein